MGDQIEGRPKSYLGKALEPPTLNKTVDPFLRLVHSSHNNLTLRREPESIVNKLGQPRRQRVPELAHFAVHGQSFNVDVGDAEDGAAGGFVAAAGLDADETVFDNVDTADAVFAAELVEVEEEFEGVGFDCGFDSKWENDET